MARPSEVAPHLHQDPNDRVEYTMWSVFAHGPAPLGSEHAAAADELRALLDSTRDDGVTTRGVYELSGFRADADWMVWWHAPDTTALQRAYRRLRATAVGIAARPVWSSVGLHRPAEFNRDHLPAYLTGTAPGRFLAVYPFVRSHDWYLLRPEERRDLLVEHGRAARDYPDVISNTVASFALGDYEWILALEAPQLHRLVDLMRDFRATGARRHVRVETPFFTGERVDVDRIVATAN